MKCVLSNASPQGSRHLISRCRISIPGLRNARERHTNMHELAHQMVRATPQEGSRNSTRRFAQPYRKVRASSQEGSRNSTGRFAQARLSVRATPQNIIRATLQEGSRNSTRRFAQAHIKVTIIPIKAPVCVRSTRQFRENS